MPTGQKQQVQLGVRIPADLKDVLSRYCTSRGVKMNYFVGQAIREKLIEAGEDSDDLMTAKERLKNPKYISQAKWTAYLHKRGVKA